MIMGEASVHVVALLKATYAGSDPLDTVRPTSSHPLLAMGLNAMSLYAMPALLYVCI